MKDIDRLWIGSKYNITNLEWLEIIYPKKSKIKNLSNLPNLKKLALQGMELNNLNGLI